MDDWTDDEADSAAAWGICEFCGGPRGTRTEQGMDDEGRWVQRTLVCLRCGRQAS